MCTVGLYVSWCLMIFLCPFLHCKALRTAMYKRYINSIIIIIIIISRVKLRQSTAIEQKFFDLRSLSPALRIRSLLPVYLVESYPKQRIS